jgi:hypothetical protein
LWEVEILESCSVRIGLEDEPWDQLPINCFAHQGCYNDGPKFMWNNERKGINYTKEHLDRALVNSMWTDLYPERFVEV